MTVHCAVDSLARNGERLFGWGWVLSERAPAERVEIRIPCEDGNEVVLPGLRTATRTDLAEAFPSIPHAATSGFMIIGRIPQPSVDRVARVIVYLQDGSHEVCELPGFPGRFVGQPLLTWRSAVHYLRKEGVVSFCGRAAHRIAGIAVGQWHRIFLRRLASSSRRRPIVVFDHAMGGGANRFREEWVARRLGDGGMVYVVNPVLSRLAYQAARYGTLIPQTMEFKLLEDALGALAALGGCDVVINNLVSFDDPLQVVHWALSQKRAGGRITFFLHDYFAACPSWTLVDDTGRYCGLPSPERCRQCLSRNAVPFLSFYPGLSITHWRAVWGRLLAECDEIVAFSRASAEILSRAYPDVPLSRIEIRPHRVDYLPAGARARANLSLPLVVGILGHISAHKGAGVLRGVIEEVRRSGAPLRFKVFGSVDNLAASELLEVLGPYKIEQLPELLQAHGVGICLLPSICPETFSYVTSEIIHFGMPLAVFDLGAPAERARAYALGRVLSSMEPKEVVRQLLEFGEDLRADQHTFPNRSLSPSGQLPS